MPAVRARFDHPGRKEADLTVLNYGEKIMFTGLVEQVGKIKAFKRGTGNATLTVSCGKWDAPVVNGDSVAVQGACLTVSSVTGTELRFDVLDETLNLTTIRHLKAGALVNLERALRADARLGGHFVSGHVDGVGTIAGIRQTGNDRVIEVQCSASITYGIVLKGSIALDGISLTVTGVGPDSFHVKIIPYTWDHTSLRQLRQGSKVNVETDIIGKYVAKYLKAGGGEGKHAHLDLAALVKAGFDA